MISILSSNPKKSMRTFIRDYKYLIEKACFNINKVVLKNGDELEFCDNKIGKKIVVILKMFILSTQDIITKFY